jgi:hypothetical protein
MASKAKTGKAAHRFPPITINSYAELLKQEPIILKRIAEVPNGGNLFMAHPFQLLADVGVVLSKQVESHILRLHPELSNLSLAPYNAVKAAGAQSVRYNIRGLFWRKIP